MQNLLKELLMKDSELPFYEEKIENVLRKFHPRSYIGYSIRRSLRDDYDR